MCGVVPLARRWKDPSWTRPNSSERVQKIQMIVVDRLR
jgi:hypothetical protein